MAILGPQSFSDASKMTCRDFIIDLAAESHIKS